MTFVLVILKALGVAAVVLFSVGIPLAGWAAFAIVVATHRDSKDANRTADDEASHATRPFRVVRSCLNYIVDYSARFGSIPTYRRIAGAIGLVSTSGVFRMIRDLERRGYLRRTGRQASSLEVFDQTKCPHCDNPLGSAACRAAATRPITYSSSPACHIENNGHAATELHRVSAR
jgi:hypothetical protein